MEDDYQVGYGKPPEDFRFKKGLSGNPKGRPKGTQNLKTDLMEELREFITVREGERAARISKQRGFVKSLLARSLKGDTRAAGIVLNMVYRLLESAGADGEEFRPLDPHETEVLAAFEQRAIKKAKAANKTPSKGNK